MDSVAWRNFCIISGSAHPQNCIYLHYWPWWGHSWGERKANSSHSWRSLHVCNGWSSEDPWESSHHSDAAVPDLWSAHGPSSKPGQSLVSERKIKRFSRAFSFSLGLHERHRVWKDAVTELHVSQRTRVWSHPPLMVAEKGDVCGYRQWQIYGNERKTNPITRTAQDVGCVL